MARDNMGDTSRFDNMSDTELIDYIGGDVDPSTSRTDLIMMAMEADKHGRDK